MSAAPDMRRAALAYAALGWRVFPLHTPKADGTCDCNKKGCASVGKHPRTLRGLKDGTTDAATIERWWGAELWPHANIGVCTGGGLFVVDVDTKQNGLENWAALVDRAAAGSLPPTPESITGSGGRHLCFAADGRLKNSTSALAPGVDTRGEGGYIVAPPSLHASGRRYAWEASSRPTEVPLAPVPPWIVAALGGGAAAAAAKPRATRAAGAGPAIAEGGRSDALFRLARSLHNKGLAEEELVAALAAVNARRCTPPLEDDEVRAIARSAATLPDRPPESGPGADWKTGLRWATRRDGSRFLLSTVANAALVLAHAPEWAGVLAWDEFGQCVVKRRAPPYPRGLVRDAGPGDWCEDDDHLTAATLEDSPAWRLKLPAKQVFAAARLAAKLHPFHPVRERIGAVAWDGRLRLDRWLIDYLGAADTPYNRRVGRWLLLAAVARVRAPGCKQDHVFVLEGEQGAYKSTAIAALALEPAWFTDSPVDFRTKDGFLAIKRKWLVEVAEIDKIPAADYPRFKAFASSPSDWYRPPYEAHNVDVPRQCVVFGSTNADLYARDPTGNRRQLPVRCGAIDLPRLRRDAPQLWAEALAEFEAGGERRRWWPQTSAELADCAEEQEDRYEPDAWEPLIADWLTEGEGRGFTQVTTAAVLLGALSFRPSELRDRAASTRVGTVLRRLGWIVTRPRGAGNPNRDRYYVRPGLKNGPTGPTRSDVNGHSTAAETPSEYTADPLDHVGPVGPEASGTRERDGEEDEERRAIRWADGCDEGEFSGVRARVGASP